MAMNWPSFVVRLLCCRFKFDVFLQCFACNFFSIIFQNFSYLLMLFFFIQYFSLHEQTIFVYRNFMYSILILILIVIVFKFLIFVFHFYSFPFSICVVIKKMCFFFVFNVCCDIYPKWIRTKKIKWKTKQEYTEEFREIAKGNKSKEALPAAPITLIHQRPVGEELPVCMSFVIPTFNFIYTFFFFVNKKNSSFDKVCPQMKIA